MRGKAMSTETEPAVTNGKEKYIRFSTNTLLIALTGLAGGNLLKSFDLASAGDVAAVKADVGAVKADVKELDDKVDELGDGLNNGNFKFTYLERDVAALRAEVEAMKRGAGK